MKSLHTLAPIQSPYDSRTTSEQYTQYSTSQCWNQHSRIQYQIGFNLRPHLSLSKTNPNSKSPTSLIPRLTTDVVASFNILSDGQVMKALTKKPLVSMPMSLEMLPNLLRISTWPIHPNQAHSQIFEVQVTSLLSKFHTLLQFQQVLITPAVWNLLLHLQTPHQTSSPWPLTRHFVAPLEHS